MRAARVAKRRDDEWAAYARERLRARGTRAGGARDAVIDLLADQSCCLAAQEVWEALRGRESPPALASVYRALETLDEVGLVKRIEFGGGISRFERARPSGEHHHHVVCDECGRITAFEDEGLERAIAAAAERMRHRVSEHEVVLRGACPSCAGRRG